MNRLFENSLFSFQWLPTNLLHFYIYAFFLFEINFIYKHLPLSKQEHMAILTKRSKECKGLFGNYQRTKLLSIRTFVSAREYTLGLG